MLFDLKYQIQIRIWYESPIALYVITILYELLEYGWKGPCMAIGHGPIPILLLGIKVRNLRIDFNTQPMTDNDDL